MVHENMTQLIADGAHVKPSVPDKKKNMTQLIADGADVNHPFPEMNGWTGNEFSKFSEVLYKVTVRSKYTRALTVEIFLVGAVLHYAASMGGTEVCELLCELLVTNCSARISII